MADSHTEELLPSHDDRVFNEINLDIDKMTVLRVYCESVYRSR